MLGFALLTVVLAFDSLGTPVRHEGFSIRPPKAFFSVRPSLFQGTRVGAIGGPSVLAALLVDSEAPDAASMVMTVVDGSFDLGPGVRDTLSTQVVNELKDELDLRFTLERVDVVPDQRVEVHGSVRAEDQVRQVLIAAFPGDVKHTIVMFSVPTGRWDGLRAAISDSLDSYRIDTVGTGQAPSRRWALAFASLLAALMLVSLGLWRRRRANATLP